MRRIILNLAISLDGFIAEQDGGYGWIKGDGDSSNNTQNIFEFAKFVNRVDTVVMGSKAYEDCGIKGIEGYESKQFIVATSRELKGEKNVEFFNGDICQIVLKKQKEEGKDIWLFGGAGLVDPFIKENLIDEYIIGIIPIILGNGRPLFRKDNPTIELHLDQCTVEDGVTILRYSKRCQGINPVSLVCLR